MQTQTRSLTTLVTVFFFWGFLAASNGIFIPFCKTHFHLNQFRSQLVDTSFYGAYFIGSLFLYLVSMGTGRDLLNSIGYKKGIVFGLLISIIGSLLMLLAVKAESFPFILLSFFVIALGFSLQQTAANPMAIYLGNPATGSHRLNLAGGVNSLGTTLGPLIVNMALFGKVAAGESEKANASIASISNLYIILCVAFSIAALLFSMSKMPVLNSDAEIDSEKKDKTNNFVLKTPLIILMSILAFIILLLSRSAFAGGNQSLKKFLFLFISALGLSGILGFLVLRFIKLKRQNRFEPKAYPQVQWGMFAIFVYVGMEVTIQSNMGALLKTPDFGSLSESHISRFLSLYWGSLMIGRLMAALSVFNLKKSWRRLFTILVPVSVFALILGINRLSGNPTEDMIIYLIPIAILVIGFFLCREKPVLTLIVFSVLGISAMLTGLLTQGLFATYSFISAGLFCSIMWPCIFTLSIAGVKQYSSQASGFLIMMILGGAFIPPLQGIVCDFDKTEGSHFLGMSFTHFSFTIPLICFLCLTLYAFRSKALLKRQGIDFDAG